MLILVQIVILVACCWLSRLCFLSLFLLKIAMLMLDSRLNFVICWCMRMICFFADAFLFWFCLWLPCWCLILLSYADACLKRLRHTCFWLLRWCLLGWVVLLIATLTLNLFSDCCANGCLLFNVVFAENLCWRLVIISCWHLLIIGCWADSSSDYYILLCKFVFMFFSCRWC